ncbi:MAG TPA: 2-dehydropantoate 2-reductase N-terminal domain-containing protein, partial [Chryseolinea sp.]|nr:2-dehydropantoate 2-reductase N-terminal domain-containing protein [Chryseolinea sp.]
MTSRSFSDKDKPVAVIGAGNFGSVIANLLAQHRKVLLYARDAKAVEQILSTKSNRGYKMHEHVTPTNDLSLIAGQCDIIFPIVPSAHFRSLMKELSPYLRPYHLLIHGTKGFDVILPDGQTIESMENLDRTMVKTMSEVIKEESVVVRMGCLAGPNLA